MKTKSLNASVYLLSLGCAKNLVDSEVFLGRLRANGFQIVDPSGEPLKQADVAIINTCGFIGDAKEESVESILELVDAKKKGIFSKVVVMGCLSQRYREDLKKEIPEVDGFFGVNEQKEMLRFLAPNLKKEMTGERWITTPKHYAYLKISEGCDRRCSFCAIPLIRGKQRSVAMEELLRETKFLAANGTKEINIIAQDTTTYGTDIYGKKMLPDLLHQLSGIRDIEWFRLHYTYPNRFPLKVLDMMKSHPNICRYLDIPLQHIHTPLLTSMKRGISKEGTLKLLDSIRHKIPDICLRTTLIVGYPGESDSAFRELYDFVRQQSFHRLGVFTYSPEEDTMAFKLGDPVPMRIKEERKEAIMQLQMDISQKRNQEKVGSRLKVIIDREEKDHFVGRTEFDSPEVDNEVLIEKPGRKEMVVGRFYEVEITGAEVYDLSARIPE